MPAPTPQANASSLQVNLQNVDQSSPTIHGHPSMSTGVNLVKPTNVL